MPDDPLFPDDHIPHFIDDGDDEEPTPVPPTPPIQSAFPAREPISEAPPIFDSEEEIAEANDEVIEDDDEPIEFESDEPQFIDPLEEDVEHFLKVTRPIEEVVFQPRIPKAPPPSEQSTFVNPAMARVAAARSRGQTREPGEFWLALRTLVIVGLASVIVAFIFNYWTPDSFLSKEFVANLQEVSSTQGASTAIPTPLPTFETVKKIGIITGHAGPPLNPAFEVDPGAICDENFDGVPELRELDINTAVSQRVARLLVEAGYEVELLNEWDPRIENYRASTLLSIHTNTCENLGFGATGFNVNANASSPMIERDNRLVDCLVASYGNATGLPRHFGSPPDLTDYHAFREVSLDTPTVIVELGFMFSDRPVLTQQHDAMAQGIFEGIDCFLGSSSVATPGT